MSKPNLPIFYDGKDYWLKIGECFRKMGWSDLKMHLEVRGIDDFDHSSARILCKLDAIRFWVQTEKFCDFAGPLAGHKPGDFTTPDGKRILVTSGSKMPEPVKGDPETFEKFAAELLPDGQLSHFLYWLKVRAESLEAGDFRASQLCAMAGESGCGKSLMQDLITEFFGGRVGKPIRYMTGQTPFNEDLAESEHWLMSDEKGLSSDIRARREFGEALKEALVVREMSVHPKGRKAITLPTWRSVTLTINDEPENLAKLPPLDDSILDKMFLFKCAKATIGSDRIKVWRKLKSDLPAVRWQLQKMVIPKDRQCPRYKVKSWQNPEIVQILKDQSPEERLLGLIDEVLDFPWTGTAVSLQSELMQSKYAFAADKLMKGSSACGTYLARLKIQHPKRFAYERTETKRQWTITAP